MVDKVLLTVAMISQGYTQKRLAEEIGISKNSFNDKINGKREFDVGEAERICIALKIDDCKEKVKIFLPKSSQN